MIRSLKLIHLLEVIPRLVAESGPKATSVWPKGPRSLYTATELEWEGETSRLISVLSTSWFLLPNLMEALSKGHQPGTCWPNKAHCHVLLGAHKLCENSSCLNAFRLGLSFPAQPRTHHSLFLKAAPFSSYLQGPLKIIWFFNQWFKPIRQWEFSSGARQVC